MFELLIKSDATIVNGLFRVNVCWIATFEVFGEYYSLLEFSSLNFPYWNAEIADSTRLPIYLFTTFSRVQKVFLMPRCRILYISLPPLSFSASNVEGIAFEVVCSSNCYISLSIQVLVIGSVANEVDSIANEAEFIFSPNLIDQNQIPWFYFWLHWYFWQSTVGVMNSSSQKYQRYTKVMLWKWQKLIYC